LSTFKLSEFWGGLQNYVITENAQNGENVRPVSTGDSATITYSPQSYLESLGFTSRLNNQHGKDLSWDKQFENTLIMMKDDVLMYFEDGEITIFRDRDWETHKPAGRIAKAIPVSSDTDIKILFSQLGLNF